MQCKVPTNFFILILFNVKYFQDPVNVVFRKNSTAIVFSTYYKLLQKSIF